MANNRTLNDYFAPVTAEPPMCITLPTTNAAQFEIRPATICHTRTTKIILANIYNSHT
ncbi:hypothetical protein LguiB_027901 [Lonicera macranthoides]